MIEVNQICKRYDSVEALTDVTFSIASNEVVGLLGPNGAGKTTLMKILTGYLDPTSGATLIDGLDVQNDPIAVQNLIGYLPENAPVYTEMVVQEYLQMIAALREIPADQINAFVSDAVISTGLEDKLVVPIAQLSKGYRQRVGLAQAILHKPKVLILDEPSTGLDPSQIVEIRKLIRRLAENATILLSTHILSEVEISCDRVLIVNQGRLCKDARLSELRDKHIAVATIGGPKPEITAALQSLSGVDRVEEIDADGDVSTSHTRFRVTSGENTALCEAIYGAVKTQDWALSELRPDPQTLESIFRENVEQA